jgi:hypothetical protein
MQASPGVDEDVLIVLDEAADKEYGQRFKITLTKHGITKAYHCENGFVPVCAIAPLPWKIIKSVWFLTRGDGKQGLVIKYKHLPHHETFYRLGSEVETSPIDAFLAWSRRCQDYLIPVDTELRFGGHLASSSSSSFGTATTTTTTNNEKDAAEAQMLLGISTLTPFAKWGSE